MVAPAGAPVRKWSPALPLLPDGRGRIAGSLSGAGPLYRGTVLAMPSEIEAEGSMGEIAAERIAWRRAGSLPQTFRHQDTILLLSDLALALAHSVRGCRRISRSGQQRPGWTSRSTVGAITYLSDSPLARSKP